MIDTSLARPRHIFPEVWQSVEAHRGRLDGALTSTPADPGAAVGAAKDLVECIARAVCEERGETSPGHEYERHVNAAHKALRSQPGPGLDPGEGLGKLINGLQRTAVSLATLRNEYGSGHGRPYLPDVAEETLEAAVGGALLWCRWALRRLGYLQHGNAAVLIADLMHSTFYSGDLAERLLAANLPALAEDEQRRLGVAVGRRAAGNTFTVAVDGIDAALSDEPGRWPEPYRRGVLDGLLTNRDGEVTLRWQTVEYAPRVAASLPDPDDALAEALGATDGARLSSRLAAATDERRQVLAEMRRQEATIPARARDHWTRLMALVDLDSPEAVERSTS